MKRGLVILAVLILALALIGCTKEVEMAQDTAAPASEAPAAPVGDDVPTDMPTDMEAETMEEGMEDDMAEDEPVVLEGAGDVTEQVLDDGVEYSLPVDVSTETEHFDEVTCALVDETLTISVKVTNSGNEPWIIYGKENPKGNLRITNRGITDITPGCAAQELAVGESTICSTVDIGTISGENRISIQSVDSTEARVVMCP